MNFDVELDLPKGYSVRRIQFGDYDRGVLEPLKELTIVGTVSRTTFGRFINYLRSHEDTHFTMVVVSPHDHIAAIGTIIIEPKLIHSAGLVGHIEDVAVRKDEQGKRIGSNLMKLLDHIGRMKGAYKNILNCTASMSSYYKNLGYKTTGQAMTKLYKDNHPLESPP